MTSSSSSSSVDILRTWLLGVLINYSAQSNTLKKALEKEENSDLYRQLYFENLRCITETYYLANQYSSVLFDWAKTNTRMATMVSVIRTKANELLATSTISTMSMDEQQVVKALYYELEQSKQIYSK